MKRFSFILFLVIHFTFCVNGQANLVPNGSFEQHTNCPDNSAGIYYAIGWSDPPSLNADLYDSCGINGCSAPANPGGFSIPEDGHGFAGLYTYVFTSANYREYIQARLDTTLEANKTYCVSFYISLGDSFQYAVNNISAYFSPNGGGTNASMYFTYTPQINNSNSNQLDDKTNWTKISGTFIANGNERYITIGNFSNDANTTTTFVGGSSTSGIPYDWREAYYYVDNVSVVEIASPITGNDTSICQGDSIQLGTASLSDIVYSWQPAIGLNNSTVANPDASPSITTTYTLTQTQCDVVSTATVTIAVRSDCNVIPDLIIPTTLRTNQIFEIIGLEPNSKLEIFDAIGRCVYVSENYQNDFGGYNTAQGTYIIRFTKPNGEVIKQKLVVIK